MPFSTVVIINLSVLAAILISDLGLRQVTWHRLARPLIVAAVIVPQFMHAFSTQGNDVILETAGVVAGALLATLAVSVMSVTHQGPQGAPRTHAGFAYAAIWSAITAARVLFIYGALHWFSGWVGREASSLHVTVAGISNALLYMAIATAIIRTVVLWGRVERDRRLRGGASIPVSARRARTAVAG